MATYIQGIEDYIPEIQQFQPDFNFYSQALQYKKSAADAARTQIADVYNSILNNPLIRDSDIKKREEFFKQIDSDIKKMSRMDLSLSQNQQEAQHVFTQLLDDKNISHDMVFTKKAQQALEYGEALRNRGDKGYWSGMSENINYTVQKYKDSKNEEALNFAAPKYIKRVDIMSEVMDKLKDIDFDVTSESPYVQAGVDKNGNPIMVESNWIIKTKNGELVEPYLQAMFSAEYASRGDVRDYYNEVAKNKRIRFLQENIEKYGSEDAANKAYVQQTLGALDQVYASQEKMMKDALENKKNDIQSTKKKIKKAEELEDEDSLIKYNQQLEEYVNELNNFTNSHSFISEQMNIITNGNNELSPEAVDALLGNISITKDISDSAKLASMKGAEVSYKQNPFKMEELKFQHEIAKENLRFKHNVALETLKADLKKQEDNEIMNKIGAVSRVENIPGSQAGDEDTRGTNVINEYLNTQGEYLKHNGMTGLQGQVLESAVSELRKIAEEGGENAWEAKQALAKILSNTTMDKEEYETLSKECGGDLNGWYNKLKDKSFDANQMDPYMIDDAYHKLQNYKHLIKDTNYKYKDKIGSINEKLKSFDIAWKGTSKAIGAALGSIDDERERNMARAYLGLAPGQKADEWDGKFSSWSEYWDLCKKYSITNNEIEDSWGDDEDGIKNVLGKAMDNVDYRTAYAKASGIMTGLDSKYSTGQRMTVTNKTGDIWNDQIQYLIGTALGNSQSSFYRGYFQETTPKSEDDARQQLAQYLTRLANTQDTKGRGHDAYSVVISPIAGGDKNMVAVHILDSSAKSDKPDFKGITFTVPRSAVESADVISNSDTYWADKMLYKYDEKVELGMINDKAISKYNSSPLSIEYDEFKRGLRVNGKMLWINQDGTPIPTNLASMDFTQKSSQEIVELLAYQSKLASLYLENHKVPEFPK